MTLQQNKSTDLDKTPSNDFQSRDALNDISDEYLGGNPNRPLQYVDATGNKYEYSLSPMLYSAIFILMVEVMERLCYNGITFSMTEYLTGVYDPSWTANFSAVEVSSSKRIS